ncbi:MFS transporter [Vreelandella profundi]|uniref:MFS transporter n=1 Tax=Vreelandella profundi TaxID=2852117 RepID=UPI001EF0FCF9|nr:MFS transporter [Halomonas profundi]
MPLVVYILGLTIFSLTTSEFMVAGMMPSLAAAFDISLEQVGSLISMYAFGMVVGGPLLTAGLLKLRVPNKSALLWLLALYAAAQSIAASTDSYTIMTLARIVTGVAASACIGTSLSICAEVVAVEARGRAASIVLGGLMLAAALGVPIATLIDQNVGWRASFWLVVALTALCAVAISIRVPLSKSSAPIGLRRELAEFKNGHLWAAYATSAFIIGATFAAFSYFTPILTEVTGFSITAIPWLLGMYGVANIVGNAVVGRYADKHTYSVMVCGLLLLIAALVAFSLLAQSATASIMMVILIGLVGVTMNPAMVARVMRTARPGTLVNTVHASVINIGLGMGVWLGGLGISAGYGLLSPLWVGTLLAVLGLLSLLPYLARRGSDSQTSQSALGKQA